MNALRKLLLTSMFVATSLACAASTLPYDEAADARVDLNRALQQAQAQHKHVLVVFGANR